MAGLILSLAGTVFGLFIPLVSLPLSAAGITVSAIALSRCRRGLAAGRGQAIAGLVVGILGILLFLVEVVAFVSIFSSRGP
jgi:hypothetical protein